MKPEDSHIMKILYSPIMYIHSDQLSEIHHLSHLLDDVLLNYWIIDHYQLENPSDTWQSNDAISSLLFSHWQVMPRVATLIGGYLLREQLLIERMSLIIDSQLSAFISLPLRYSITVTSEQRHLNYSHWGAAFITGLATVLPYAFQQRLRLCFPPDMLLPEMYIVKEPDNINLLKMAINYAYDYQK